MIGRYFRVAVEELVAAANNQEPAEEHEREADAKKYAQRENRVLMGMDDREHDQLQVR